MSDSFDPIAYLLQGPQNSTHLWGYYKIGCLAKRAQFEDITNRGA